MDKVFTKYTPDEICQLYKDVGLIIVKSEEIQQGQTYCHVVKQEN